MLIYSISQEQFNYLNRELSLEFDIEYHHILCEKQQFEVTRVGRGGATKGTTGYKFTKEQKKNMSESAKLRGSNRNRKKLSEESKKKISAAHLGKKISDEQRKKMSDSHKLRWSKIKDPNHLQ